MARVSQYLTVFHFGCTFEDVNDKLKKQRQRQQQPQRPSCTASLLTVATLICDYARIVIQTGRVTSCGHARLG